MSSSQLNKRWFQTLESTAQSQFVSLTPLAELDVGLSSAVAVFHITRVVSQVTLLHGVYGQRDGNLLLSQMLPNSSGIEERRRGELFNNNFYDSSQIDSQVHAEHNLLSALSLLYICPVTEGSPFLKTMNLLNHFFFISNQRQYG